MEGIVSTPLLCIVWLLTLIANYIRFENVTVVLSHLIYSVLTWRSLIISSIATTRFILGLLSIMRSHLHSLAALAWLLESTLAFPGMAKTLMEIKKRAASPIASPEDSSELFGDLETVGVTTNVGQVIAHHILFSWPRLTLQRLFQTFCLAKRTARTMSHILRQLRWERQNVQWMRVVPGSMSPMKWLLNSRANPIGAIFTPGVPSVLAFTMLVHGRRVSHTAVQTEA